MRINTNQYNINFGSQQSKPSQKITAAEFFAGGGGWTSGLAKLPEIEVKWILNHDKVALKTNAYHHKGVKVYWADLYVQDEHEMEPVDYIHASIECDQHSNANAGKKKKIGAYTMGWEFFRYVKHLLPSVISIENVQEFKKWSPLDKDNEPIKEREGEEFQRWVSEIKALGYEYVESIRNSADDGLPTRRVRYFCFFHRPGINITFPEYTHSKTGTDGKEKWESCRKHIDTEDHGVSLFGREFNMDLPAHLRKPLCSNSIRRIAGGIKKNRPDIHAEFLQFLAKYHAGNNPERSQGLDEPITVIDTSNRHQLVTAEKIKFILDHCHSDKVQGLDEPLDVQTTQQTKRIVTVDHLITQYYGGGIQSNNLDQPINVIPCRDTHQLVRLEKVQFIAKYFNSWGNPEDSVESLDDPLSPVLTSNKHQLVTLLDDFDIKVRFLREDELAGCSTFEPGYFSAPELKLSHKTAVQLIGNAVPPKWATKIVGPNVKSMLQYKFNQLN